MLGSAKGDANRRGNFAIDDEPVKLAKIAATENEYIVSRYVCVNGFFDLKTES